MSHHESLGPDPTALPVDFHFGHRGHCGSPSRGIGYAPACQNIPTLSIPSGGGPCLPAGCLGSCLDHGDIARIGQILQAELDRILTHGCRYLVDERLAGEMNLRALGISKMGSPERGSRLQKGRNRLPELQFVGEVIGLRGHAVIMAGILGPSDQQARQRVAGTGLVGAHIPGGETLGFEHVGDHIAFRIESGAKSDDRCRSFRIPPVSLMTHALDPNRSANGFGKQCSIHCRITRVVATVGARTRHPDASYLVHG